MRPPRWSAISESGFEWEREALDFLREHLPDHEPYRAWSNLEFIASRLARADCGWALGASLYRQCRGDYSRGLVDPGLRSGRRHLVQKDRRRLPEGQRQHDRLHDYAVRADAAEDRLGDDERRRPGFVPEHPG